MNKTTTLWTVLILVTAVFLGFYMYDSLLNTSSDKPIVVESVDRPERSGTVVGPAGDMVGNRLENLPDTDLVNQRGDRFRFQGLPDRPVLLSFIFTRCPMEQMCPLVTRKMDKVRSRLNDSDGAGLHLVSVTMDPAYDTPPVLRQYASDRDIPLENWDFVTGPLDTIRQVENRFHVSVLRKNDELKTHNMRTYVIDSDRVVRAVYTGSDWSVDDVVNRIRQLSPGE